MYIYIYIYIYDIFISVLVKQIPSIRFYPIKLWVKHLHFDISAYYGFCASFAILLASSSSFVLTFIFRCYMLRGIVGSTKTGVFNFNC